jgi:hypothetical protein
MHGVCVCVCVCVCVSLGDEHMYVDSLGGINNGARTAASSVLCLAFIQVRVGENEDLSCYELARRWLVNDADGVANPLYRKGIRAQAAVPGMGPYPGGLGMPGGSPAVPYFWELDPITLPPRLPEPSREPSPPPVIRPLPKTQHAIEVRSFCACLLKGPGSNLCDSGFHVLSSAVISSRESPRVSFRRMYWSSN